MSASVRQYKAPYRYARKGRTLVLMERGNATGQTFSSEANAKRTVLELNDAWRAKGAKKSNPRSRSNPYFGNGLLHDDDVFLDLQAIWKRGISPDVKPYRLRNYTERQTKKFYAQYGSGILNDADDYEMAVADWARTYPPTDLMKKANPARPLRRNFLGLFGPKGPRFKVDEHRRDIRNKVEVVSETVGEEDLRWQLFEAGIRKAELDSTLAQAKAAPKTTFYNKHDDLVEVTCIEAKKNPARKYDESKDAAGYRKLSDLKKGEFFKRKADARKVYRKGDYDRSERKYEAMDEDDISRSIYLKGDTLVYVGFDY